MYQHILVPLDNSSTDETILMHIRPLARLTQAQLLLVHVADGFAARLQTQLNLADSEEIKKDQNYLDEKCKQLVNEGFRAKAVLAQGREPGQAIIDLAKAEKCDLIAMATHGHGFVKDIILGSVADYLRHNTDIPILMVKDPEK